MDLPQKDRSPLPDAQQGNPYHQVQACLLYTSVLAIAVSRLSGYDIGPFHDDIAVVVLPLQFGRGGQKLA